MMVKIKMLNERNPFAEDGDSASERESNLAPLSESGGTTSLKN